MLVDKCQMITNLAWAMQQIMQLLGQVGSITVKFNDWMTDKWVVMLNQWIECACHKPKDQIIGLRHLVQDVNTKSQTIFGVLWFVLKIVWFVSNLKDLNK
jgi:glycine cleavage system protein P-like pyridoxal-binding family